MNLSWPSRLAAVLITLLLVVGVGSVTRAQTEPPTSTASPSPISTSQEPPLLKIILDAGWKLNAAQAHLPPVQVVHKEQLETQDWIEYAYDGGALRLYISSANKKDIFAILVDTRKPEYAEFSQPFFGEHYQAYRDGPYMVVVPVHPVPQTLFETLRTKRWSGEELQQQLGAPSYEWHVHGIGWEGMTYVPQGLDFIGDRDSSDAPTMFQLHDEKVENEMPKGSFGLPQLSLLSTLDYATYQRRSRESVAKTLLDERKEIDEALANGIRSPDGHLVAGEINFSGLIYSAEFVIGEPGKPERRLSPRGTLGKWMWLNPRTIIYFEQGAWDEISTLDVNTGAKTTVAKTPEDLEIPYDQAHHVEDFGVSGPDKFWYTTGDGNRHEVTVSQVKAEGTK